MIKLVEVNREINLCDVVLGNDFLRYNTIRTSNKRMIGNLVFIKIENFVLQRTPPRKVK